MLKTRRALDKKAHRGRGPRVETLMSFRRTQAHARWLSTEKKRIVDQVCVTTQHQHPNQACVEQSEENIWQNVCPPKQYQKGKDGAPITDPKDIANEHAAAFTDNSSSAHYSVRFQNIKAQDDRVRIDFTSDNTEVFNKPFRLRDLRRSILKAKPGPDGIHNNLLKHLHEDTLKILKDILNIILISGDFPPQWRAATVILIPKPNKDHTDPLSYRPIAPTSCRRKVHERQLDSIHNAGLKLALGAFCISPVSSMYTEANEAPLEERQLQLSVNYNLKTRTCTDNPAHRALHEFDPTTRDLYLPRPNGKGGMTRPPAKPIGLKVEEAMTSAEIDIEMVCPLKTPTLPPGTHEYDPKRHRASLKGWANVWWQEKRLRPNSESIAMLKDHMSKSTLTDLRLTREWGQQRSSTAISRMVRGLAISCPKDSQVTVPSLLLRQQQSHWHSTIIGTRILYSTM